MDSPVINYLLNSSATVLEINSDNSINILDPTASIPGALFIFNLPNFVLTVSGVTVGAFAKFQDSPVRSFIHVRPVWEVWPAFVYSLRTVLRRVRTVGVGTQTILTHNNLNKHPAWRIALAKFTLAANLPLQRFYKTVTCPNVTITLHCTTCISIKWLRVHSINDLDQSDWNQEGPTDACPTNWSSVQTGAARPCWGPE